MLEDSKKIKESLEEVKENGESRVRLGVIKTTISRIIMLQNMKKPQKNYQSLIDEEGEEERIMSREKEEQVGWLVCVV